MMHRVRLVPSVIWFIVLSALGSTFACNRTPYQKKDLLILEIGGKRPMRHYVPPTGVFYDKSWDFEPLGNWRRPPDQDADVGATCMDYRREGDGVRINMTVILGYVDASECDFEEARIKSAGTYLIRIGESASLDGLAQFGVQPIKVGVVSAK